MIDLWISGLKLSEFLYDKISDLEVNVNPIENMLGVGTIQAFSGRVSNKGGRIYDKFIGIIDPSAVFKMIKEVTVDIKTDWNYPNAMRPDINPGYNTKYERKRIINFWRIRGRVLKPF